MVEHIYMRRHGGDWVISWLEGRLTFSFDSVKNLELLVNAPDQCMPWSEDDWDHLADETTQQLSGFCTTESFESFVGDYADLIFKPLGWGNSGRVVQVQGMALKIASMLPYNLMNSQQWRSLGEANALIQTEYDRIQQLHVLNERDNLGLLLPELHDLEQWGTRKIMVMPCYQPAGKLTYQECYAVWHHYMMLMRCGFYAWDEIEVMRDADGQIVVIDYGDLIPLAGASLSTVKDYRQSLNNTFSRFFRDHGHSYWVSALQSMKAAKMIHRFKNAK